jgi:hypothetical protein
LTSMTTSWTNAPHTRGEPSVTAPAGVRRVWLGCNYGVANVASILPEYSVLPIAQCRELLGDRTARDANGRSRCNIANPTTLALQWRGPRRAGNVRAVSDRNRLKWI